MHLSNKALYKNEMQIVLQHSMYISVLNWRVYIVHKGTFNFDKQKVRADNGF